MHEIEMERTIVPIIDGLPAIPLDQEYLNALAEATRQSFPHAQESMSGGCIIRVGAPKRAAIYVCKDCRSAKRDWMGHHKPNPKPNPSVQPSAVNSLP